MLDEDPLELDARPARLDLAFFVAAFLAVAFFGGEEAVLSVLLVLRAVDFDDFVAAFLVEALPLVDVFLALAFVALVAIFTLHPANK